MKVFELVLKLTCEAEVSAHVFQGELALWNRDETIKSQTKQIKAKSIQCDLNLENVLEWPCVAEQIQSSSGTHMWRVSSSCPPTYMDHKEPWSLWFPCWNSGKELYSALKHRRVKQIGREAGGCGQQSINYNFYILSWVHTQNRSFTRQVHY